jgi:hypothetical protein
MGARTRKLALAVHLTCSVGWIGAVFAYVVLDLTVASSRDPDVIRSAWFGMGAITSRVIVPFAGASVLTGFVVSLGTPWGLLRHWWVVISLLLTLFAALVLFTEAGFIARAAERASDPAVSSADLLALPHTLPHSVGGLAVLLIVQVLNVYKPKGLTPYGWRRQQAERAPRTPNPTD